jgi:hypothetical protein
VYSTVDRRYYHVNVPGGEQYFEVNLQPGYQQMCGDQALQFVSYRHGDTSLVRDARDQAFLLDVKKQFGPTLVDNTHKFEFIFGRTVQTDQGLHSTNGLLNLLGTLVSSVSKPVRQVQFKVTLQPTGANPCSCDTATPQQIKASVHSFLYGANKQPKAHVAAVAHSVHNKKVITRLPLVTVPSQQRGRAHRLARRLPFPLEYPRVQDKGGTGVPPYLLSYVIHAPGGVNYPAYVAVFSAGQLGQFYDVQGTPWTTQPELDSPDQTLKVGGRTYYLYYSGQHLRIVAWYDQNDVYWVHNTLSDSVGNGELLAIAEQTVPVSGSRTLAAKARVSLRAAHLPLRLSTTSTLSLRQKLGAIAALVAVPLLLLMAFMLIRGRRDVRSARERLAAGLTTSARLAPAGGWASPGASGAAPNGGAGTFLDANGRAAGGRRIRPSMILAAILILVSGAGLGLALTFAGSRVVHGTRHTATHKKRPPGALAPPSVPVVILNSTAVPDAARKLSSGLRSRGVKISGVGNVAGPRPVGLQVLYAPQERTQARRLAALLAGQLPSIAPVDPVAAGAAGGDAKLVLVIG